MQQETARYLSKWKLLCQYMETADRVQIAVSRAAHDVWLGFIACVMDLDADKKFQSWMPTFRGRSLFSNAFRGFVCAYLGHNDFLEQK